MNGIPSDAWWDYGSAYNFDMLVAGADADNASASGGALPFAVNSSPSRSWWNYGSALSCSLLVRLLTTLLPGVVL